MKMKTQQYCPSLKIASLMDVFLPVRETRCTLTLHICTHSVTWHIQITLLTSCSDVCCFQAKSLTQGHDVLSLLPQAFLRMCRMKRCHRGNDRYAAVHHVTLINIIQEKQVKRKRRKQISIDQFQTSRTSDTPSIHTHSHKHTDNIRG